MSEKSKLMFLVLVISGTFCILGALGAVGYLYQQNADGMAKSIPGEIPKAAFFFAFVIIPSALTFVVGIGMVVTGVRIGLKDDRT